MIDDFRLNYTNFTKIGQPKLSERVKRRLVVTPSPYWETYSRIEDYGLKVSVTLRSLMSVLRRKGGAPLLALLVSDI